MGFTILSIIMEGERSNFSKTPQTPRLSRETFLQKGGKIYVVDSFEQQAYPCFF